MNHIMGSSTPPPRVFNHLPLEINYISGAHTKINENFSLWTPPLSLHILPNLNLGKYSEAILNFCISFGKYYSEAKKISVFQTENIIRKPYQISVFHTENIYYSEAVLNFCILYGKYYSEATLNFLISFGKYFSETILNFFIWYGKLFARTGEKTT